LLGQIELGENKIEAITFHVDRIYAAMANREIWIWDVKNLEEKSILTVPLPSNAEFSETTPRRMTITNR